MAAAAALAAVLVLGVVRLGPPLAATLGQALSGIFAPGEATAPGLDGLERALLAGATSSDADGPTLLDVRTHLRSRLDRSAADAAFDATLRPLVRRALDAESIGADAGTIAVVDRAAEDAWVRNNLHPGRLDRAVEIAANIAAAPSRILAVALDLGLGADGHPDGIYPGHAAGDIVVEVDSGAVRQVVMRRRAGSGFAVLETFDASGAPARAGGG